jgi:hypothetical protein
MVLIKCIPYSSASQLTLPSAMKYLPLFLNSLLKKPIMRKIKSKFHPNIISNFIQQVVSLPLNLLIKLLYPRVYRLDDLVVEGDEEIAVILYKIE